MDFNTNEYTVTGICDEAGIFGNDGSSWAWSPGFPEFKAYDYNMEGMDGSITPVPINEHQCCLDASQGKRTPSDAGGIRIGNVKYMFINYDDTNKCVQLSKSGGGACIAAAGTCFIVGFWTKDKAMAPKGVQTASACAEQVQNMAAFLSEQGF
jgi:hypothetical protein